jgi:hypothetical protein
MGGTAAKSVHSEKSWIQALDRTQPGLPMKKGRCGTMTHDYKRHGTTTLFAALDVLDGKVIGQCMTRHRHQEFIRFLNKINRETPGGRELHQGIVDLLDAINASSSKPIKTPSPSPGPPTPTPSSKRLGAGNRC